MKDPIVDRLIAARIKLMWDHPFYGHLILRLELKDASDTKWCTTAATDGNYLYYNRSFIESLTDEELHFLLAHEILHVAYDHMGRRGNKEKNIWNMAIDYIVNYTLVEAGIGTMPACGLYNPNYNDTMSSEEVYNDLMKNAKHVVLSMDQHMDGEGSGEEDGLDEGEGMPTIQNLEGLRIEIMNDMINAVANCRNAGHVPLGIRRLIKDFTSPQISWRDYLETQMKSTLRDDFSFQKPSRRSWHLGCILPGLHYEDTIDIVLALDCSGSIDNDMVRQYLGEIKGMVQQYSSFKIHLMSFDVRVYSYKVFTPENIMMLDDYEIKGGGGTHFSCVWKWLKENELVPKKIVMFTDMCPGDGWGDPHYADTIFVNYGWENIIAPHGTTVRYDRKNK